MDENKKELVKKLRKTANLLYQSKQAEERMETLYNDENRAHRSLINSTNEKIEKMISDGEQGVRPRPTLPEGSFTFPPKRPETPDCDDEKKVMYAGIYGFLMYFAFVFVAIIWIISSIKYIYFIDAHPMVMVVVFVGLMLPWILVGRKRADVFNYDENCKAYEQKLQEWSNQFDETLKSTVISSLLKECVDFDKSFLGFVNNTRAQINVAIEEQNQKRQSIELEYQKSREETQQHLNDVKQQLASIGVLSPSYYYLATNIADILESGRADTLKEGLNLAIDDERKENEAEQRRQEAQRQADILRAQAQEQERHNREMERNAQEQAQEQARYNREMEKNSRQQANKRYDTSMCSKCYNYYHGSCNQSFVRQTGTCGAFRPNR